jgi:glycosyltransferase involved in cell wall biosynthesis
LISLVGAIDARKSVVETIKALRAAKVAKSDRLVIAGSISPDQMAAISDAGVDLVEDGSLIVRNGFVSESDYAKYLTASDVVCLPYRGFSGLSAVLFEAVAAGRPVLAHRWDWSEAIIQRFQLGWTCDVAKTDEYAHVLGQSLLRSSDYRHGPAAGRLLAFNTPDNFAATWLQFVVERTVHKTQLQPKSWQWVVDGAEQS